MGLHEHATSCSLPCPEWRLVVLPPRPRVPPISLHTTPSSASLRARRTFISILLPLTKRVHRNVARSSPSSFRAHGTANVHSARSVVDLSSSSFAVVGAFDGALAGAVMGRLCGGCGAVMGRLWGGRCIPSSRPLRCWYAHDDERHCSGLLTTPCPPRGLPRGPDRAV